MPRTRRTYKAAFKTEAVKLVTEQGYSVAEADRSRGALAVRVGLEVPAANELLRPELSAIVQFMAQE